MCNEGQFRLSFETGINDLSFRMVWLVYVCFQVDMISIENQLWDMVAAMRSSCTMTISPVGGAIIDNKLFEALERQGYK